MPTGRRARTRSRRAHRLHILSRITLEGSTMADLERELKELIVSALNLEDITADDIASDEQLFVNGLGLDSIDGLELGMALRKKYGVKPQGSKEEIRALFATVRSIARCIEAQRAA